MEQMFHSFVAEGGLRCVSMTVPTIQMIEYQMVLHGQPRDPGGKQRNRRNTTRTMSNSRSRDVCSLQLLNITSNSVDIMSHFPLEDGAKSLEDLIFQPLVSCGTSCQTPGPSLRVPHQDGHHEKQRLPPSSSSQLQGQSFVNRLKSFVK